MDILEAYKHCPRCKHNLTAKANHLHCSSCGLEWYDNPRPCTNVIINKGHEYLLVIRAVEPGRGLWSLPGGFIEMGEDFETGARREVKEELGTKIKSLRYIGSFTEAYEYKDINYRTVSACYLASLAADANLKPADDVASFAWFKKDELPFDKFAFPGMKKMFDLI